MERNFPKCSEKEHDVAAFSVTTCIMVLSVGEPDAAGFSVEMSDSSVIYSQSRVPVEVVKSWPCSTGVAALVYIL